MLGFLGTEAGMQYDANLILQIAVLVLLVIGRRLAKNKKLLTHGRAMGTLLILHTIAILLVMIPSFLINFGSLRNISDPRVIITWIHIILGTSAEALGVFLVSKWRFQPKSVAACVKRGHLMKSTFTLWALSAILGIAFYAVYYL
jgi:uncharacterized membrane protein YozB (DUF420 family)